MKLSDLSDLIVRTTGGCLSAKVELVRVLVDVPETGSLCFVEADWPLIGGAFAARGIHVLWPKRLAKLLSEANGPIDVASVRQSLAAHFKPA